MTDEFAQVPAAVVSTKVSVTLPPQLSVAVACTNDGTAGQLTVDGAGNAAITGGTLSMKLMTCEAVDAFPQASWAVHIRVMVYDPAQAPGVVVSTYVNVNALPHASVAVACAKFGVSEQEMVVGAGSGSITGAALSTTLMICDVVEMLPHASTAVQIFSIV